MKRSVLVRLLLGAVGVVVWGYGYRTGQPDVTLIAIVILAVALVMRFIPGRFFGDPPPPAE